MTATTLIGDLVGSRSSADRRGCTPPSRRCSTGSTPSCGPRPRSACRSATSTRASSPAWRRPARLPRRAPGPAAGGRRAPRDRARAHRGAERGAARRGRSGLVGGTRGHPARRAGTAAGRGAVVAHGVRRESRCRHPDGQESAVNAALVLRDHLVGSLSQRSVSVLRGLLTESRSATSPRTSGSVPPRSPSGCVPTAWRRSSPPTT